MNKETPAHLFLAAHPDDLEFNCSNLIRYLVGKGRRVVVGCMTRGEFGVPVRPSADYPHAFKGSRLGKIRARELLRAAAKNGVTDVRFLGAVDGSITREGKWARVLEELVREVGPRCVFAPEPYWTVYQHRDHTNLGYLARLVISRMRGGGVAGVGPRLFFYTSLKNTFYFPFGRAGRGTTMDALAEHRSQLWMLRYIPLVFPLAFGTHFLRTRTLYAEAYREATLDDRDFQVRGFRDALLSRLAGFFLRFFPYSAEHYTLPGDDEQPAREGGS
ncbi:MAG: PIG-L deacetylase family protein [Promethearchaeota archaeon]